MRSISFDLSKQLLLCLNQRLNLTKHRCLKYVEVYKTDDVQELSLTDDTAVVR